MSFYWPHLLWLAAAVPALIGLQILLDRPPRKSRESASSPAPRPDGQIRRGAVIGGRARFGPSVGRPMARPWRFWLAALLLVTALARPQWGQAPASADDAAPGEVVIALDLSRSMLVSDVSPSRLIRARALALRLADDLPDRRIGLIGYAGEAHLLAPVSEDQAILRTYLPDISPEHMPSPGSNLQAMLEVALSSFSDTPQGRVLVVLSDGEAEPGPWRTSLAGLRAQGVRVIAVGLGTEAGGAPPGPDGAPLRAPDGTPVISRLSPEVLTALAAGGAAGGQSLDLAAAVDLSSRVRAASAAAPEATGLAAARAVQAADQFVWFAAAALILLAWSAAVEVPAHPRLRQARTPGLGRAVLLVALALTLAPASLSLAQGPLLTEADLQGEEDPLLQMRSLAEELVTRRRLTAGDYKRVTDVAIRYGEIHRGHGHPLEDGVMRDGLAAIVEGRRLDPDLTDWAAAEAKLKRLLTPPPPVPMEDPGPADPANEPMDATGEQPVAGEEAKPGEGESSGEDDEAPTAGEQGLQNVGGSKSDQFDPAEWRNPALVQPLDTLRRLRAADSPGELFLRRQAARTTPRPAGAQTW
ncbi:VWA domain-containing protein [Phenylobacterium sp.]|uniref:VWA domain-containing protein n=1 Tax=Phenylobacterium sp. TaxID=1871053 RepID=UPI002730E021|nr:VWA domain-containing protein [Phenylobacterium sp.]MDP1874490.1 VWA domain-containing protein [Phenylobacterium sp.]